MHLITFHAIDPDGYDLITPREYDTLAEARAFAREYYEDRAFWVRHAESDTFPDGIDFFVVRCNGKDRSTFIPSWGWQPMENNQ